jgi:hypothetical protein
MPLQVEITKEPGLQEMLSGEEAVPDDQLAPALAAFRDSPGVAGTALQETLDDAIRRRAEAADESFGWWDAFRRWLAGEQSRVVDHLEEAVELEAYWLTLPDTAGAKVTVTSSISKAGETSAALTIAGIGGGPTFTIDVKEAVGFVATQTERVELSVPGTFDIVEVTRDGAVIAKYPRLRELDKNNLSWTIRPSPAPDPAPFGQPTSTRTFDASGSTGTTTDTLTITKGTTWELGVDLKFAKLGLEAKVGTKVTYTREVMYAYELPGGHNYQAASYRGFPAFLWTVQ